MWLKLLPSCRSFDHICEEREVEWMSLSQRMNKGIFSLGMSKMTDVSAQS
jgi:hypothetical protein